MVILNQIQMDVQYRKPMKLEGSSVTGIIIYLRNELETENMTIEAIGDLILEDEPQKKQTKQLTMT